MTSNPLPPGERRPGSVGLGQGVEVRILDAAGREVPRGTDGEICVRGANVTAGYINNAAANAASFTADRFFRTGDQGRQDERGYVTITGRIKELINKGGEKISPIELDNTLAQCPDVAEAVCFGYADEHYGEEVGAAVVLKQGAAAGVEELRRFMTEKVAKFKVPKTPPAPPAPVVTSVVVSESYETTTHESSTWVVTHTVPLYTTICPVTETQPAQSNPPAPPAPPAQTPASNPAPAPPAESVPVVYSTAVVTPPGGTPTTIALWTTICPEGAPESTPAVVPPQPTPAVPAGPATTPAAPAPAPPVGSEPPAPYPTNPAAPPVPPPAGASTGGIPLYTTICPEGESTAPAPAGQTPPVGGGVLPPDGSPGSLTTQPIPTAPGSPTGPRGGESTRGLVPGATAPSASPSTAGSSSKSTATMPPSSNAATSSYGAYSLWTSLVVAAVTIFY
ncbi:hypothetical protein KEM52_001194 [Ascosphaera acerosa]|nr:hypothetical protein KEM52_001194 [Ascosphaera acerosa]